MKFLLIHQAFASPNDHAGTRHFELAQHVVKQGHDFTVVASSINYATGQKAVPERGFITRHTIQGIQIARAYTYPSIHKSYVWRVISFLSFMLTSVWAALRVGPVDVVMGTSPPIFQAVSALVVAKIRRRPFLLEIRDLWPEFAIDIGILTNPMLIRLSKWLERFLYKHATHLLVNSPAYRDYLIGKNVKPEKITLISNGVDVSLFEPSIGDDHFRTEWKLQDQFVVMYAGALGIANDIPTILRAAALVKDEHIRFLLVGDGKERSSLESMAQSLGLTNVSFTGPIAKSDIPRVLAASDACIATLKNIPMFRTTYPNKVFDYMAAGKPTILAIDGVIRTVVEAAQGGIFVQPGDDAELAEAILTLFRDRALTRTMGERAHAYVKTHFDRSQQANDFNTLLEHIGRKTK